MDVIKQLAKVSIYVVNEHMLFLSCEHEPCVA